MVERLNHFDERYKYIIPICANINERHKDTSKNMMC